MIVLIGRDYCCSKTLQPVEWCTVGNHKGDIFVPGDSSQIHTSCGDVPYPDDLPIVAGFKLALVDGEVIGGEIDGVLFHCKQEEIL